MPARRGFWRRFKRPRPGSARQSSPPFRSSCLRLRRRFKARRPGRLCPRRPPFTPRNSLCLRRRLIQRRRTDYGYEDQEYREEDYGESYSQYRDEYEPDAYYDEGDYYGPQDGEYGGYAQEYPEEPAYPEGGDYGYQEPPAAPSSGRPSPQQQATQQFDTEEILREALRYTDEDYWDDSSQQ